MNQAPTNDTPDVAGWAIVVRTQPMSGGEPIMCLYACANPQRDTAISILKAKLDDDGDTIGEAYPLSAATVKGLGLQADQHWML